MHLIDFHPRAARKLLVNDEWTLGIHDELTTYLLPT